MAFLRHSLSWILISVFGVAAFSRHGDGSALLRKESELAMDSIRASTNLDVMVTRISWYIKQDTSIEGMLFSFKPERDVYYSSVRWAAPPTGTPAGTYTLGVGEWFVKYEGTFENNSAWKSFKFTTNLLNQVQYGTPGALSETRVAATCRQIVGISFSGGDPSGVVEKMRPAFLTELQQTVQAVPAVTTAANRLGGQYGCGNKLRVRQVAQTPKSCSAYGDVHYTTNFKRSSALYKDVHNFGSHWIARAKNGSFGVQAFHCGYTSTSSGAPTVTGALKVRSGNNWVVIYGNGTTLLNGRTLSANDVAFGVYTSQCLNDIGGVNESDGDGSLSWTYGSHTNVGGVQMRWLDYELKMDADVIGDFGYCNADWNDAAQVSSGENYFTTPEINAILGSPYNCRVNNATQVQGSAGTGEAICNTTSVPFVNAVIACASFVDTGMRLSCQVEYCASIANRGVPEYIDRVMESTDCSNSRLAMQSCAIVENICLAATNTLNVSNQSDFFRCQQVCMFTDDCKQASFNSAGRTCTLSREVAPKPILGQTSRNQNCTSTLCGKGKDAWFFCDCGCYGNNVTSQSVLGRDVCVCDDGFWPRCSNSKNAIDDRSAKCCEFW